MRVVVASDRPVVARGLVAALRVASSEHEVRLTHGIAECLALLDWWHPEAAVVDLVLVDGDRQRLCVRLREARTRSVHIIAGPAEALQVLVAGADGVSTSAAGLDGVVDAVRTVGQGHTHVPQELLGGVLHGLIEHRRVLGQESRGIERLSAREREVLILLADGGDQVDIAQRLSISSQTAKTHIRHVLGKLGVGSRIEAVAVAEQAGLIRPEVTR